MKILALDVFENKLTELVSCLRCIYPQAEIVSFTDPFYAAKYGINHKVDMVFTEIFMGGLGGITVAGMIRNSNKQALVVFLADTEKYRNESKEISHSTYLVRPVTANVIREAVAV